MLQWIVIIYFLVINLVLFSMMGYDKTSKTWGLAYSERRLLTIGLVGGGLGGLMGQKKFHHKTQNQFCIVLFNWRNRDD